MFALFTKLHKGTAGGFGTDNTINTWAEPQSVAGLTANTVIDSNTEPAGNNMNRGY